MLSTTINTFLLVICIHIVTVISQGGNITCTVPPTHMFQDAVLTCNIPEDLNVTKKDFTVYHYLDHNADAVVDCWWLRGNMSCSAQPNVQYQRSVNTTFTVTVVNVSSIHAGTYTCQFVDNDPKIIQKCQLEILIALSEDSGHISVIGLSLGLLAAVLLVAGAIVFYIMYRRRNMRASVWKEEESPMVSPENWHKNVTEEFQAFLLDKVNDMYPNMLNECYFVPPVYFNKTRYSQQSVADQVFYVPHPPNLKDIRHDRAMQHVIHCLRHMAEQYQEQMFVLTQFSNDDYLRCPSPEYTGHRLPVPGGLAGGTRDQDIGCFDFLIIHRHYGVVVGVVKTVGDKDDGSEDGERKTDELLISEVSEGLRQLQRAESMIQHLISDMRPIPVVRLSLMLPNITKSTIKRVFDRTNKGKEDKNMETNVELCLCADHLSHPLRPWDVDSGVMSVFREWWDQVMSSAVHGPSMSDEVYRDMISRFCGPATVSDFKINNLKHSQLPKTLNEAVMLTGDLFERLTLSHDIANLLEEPRVCLAGPPGTGKSKILALVGKKWISEGHTVHLINTCPEGSDAITQLHNFLLQNSTGHSPDTPVKPVIRVFCNIDNSREIHKMIKFLISEKKGKTYCALIDEPDADKAKLTRLQEFLVKLNEKHPDSRVWVAISPPVFNPPGWTVETLKIPFTCPPSVIREASKETHEELFSTNSKLLPTDGLPVKTICHRGQDHTGKEPRDCDACGKEIVRFFTRDLGVVTQGKSLYLSNTQNTTEYQQATSLQTTGRQSPSVQWQDVLLLFENKVTDDSPMIQLLKKSGIPVQVINSNEIEKLQMTKVKDVNIMFAGNIRFPFVRKRKVVVYVEGNIDRSTLLNGTDY